MNEKLKDTAYIDNLLEKYEYKRKLVEAISKMTLSEIYNEAEEMGSLIKKKIHHIEQDDNHDKSLMEHLEFLQMKITNIVLSITVFDKSEPKVKKMFLDLKLGNIN